MKKILFLLVVPVAFLLVIPIMPIKANGLGTSVDLLAGQHHKVGTVTAWNSSENLYVDYELDQEAIDDGWCLIETHVHVGLSLADFPLAGKQGNPIPGQFDFSDPHGCVIEYEYEIPFLNEWEGEDLLIAAHAVIHQTNGNGQGGAETAWGAGTRFTQKGNWGTYFLFIPRTPVTKTFPEVGTAYIGYEDRSSGSDFDYNDFGMNMELEETYVDDVLQSIFLKFTAVVNRAGDVHDINISRPISGDYTYTIKRSEAPYSSREADEVTDANGTGDFDIILFDSARWPNNSSQVMGQWVEIEITMAPGNNSNLLSDYGVAPRWDLDEIFSLYNPWMLNRSHVTGQINIDRVQPATTMLPTQGYDVPYILVVPYTDWPAPSEAVTITGLYPDFDDYYSFGSPEDWYLP